MSEAEWALDPDVGFADSDEVEQILITLAAPDNLTKLPSRDWDFVKKLGQKFADDGYLTVKRGAALAKIKASFDAPATDNPGGRKLAQVGGLSSSLDAWETEFFGSVSRQFDQKGSLSERQIAVLDRIIVKYAPRPAPETGAGGAQGGVPVGQPGVDLSNVPSGRYAVEQRRYKIDNVDAGKWAGWIFVKDGSAYGMEERFGGQRPGQGYYRGKREEDLRIIAADPLAASKHYGHITSSCGVCGRPLENPESVALGIGPICLANFG